MDKEKQEQKHSKQVAVIGLVGTILTVCGGLVGAFIGGITTVYRIQQEAQQLSIAAPQEEQALTVDTRQVSISVAQAADLDSSDYLVVEGLGFVMAQPAVGWELSSDMTYQDLFLEQNTNLSPLILFSAQVETAWDRQPVYRLRYSQPVTVEFIDGSTENGIPVDVTQLEDPILAFYSQMTILVLEKIQAPDFTLVDLALGWGHLHRGGVNSIVANPDSQYVFEQVSWELKNVLAEERNTDLTLQRWALFAEGNEFFYIVEVQYIPATNQSVQVWDDLQSYLSAFRVIQ
ncbi:MAG: hypothetical protein AB1531_05885 [Chloroflexota bacterium]